MMKSSLSLLMTVFAVSCVSNSAPPATITTMAVAPASEVEVTSVEDAAIAKYRAKLEKNPKLYPVWAQLGIAVSRRAREIGDATLFDEAARCLEKSLAIQESEEGYAGLAAVRLDQHRFAEAHDLANRAIEIMPEDGIARAISTDALIAMGRYDDAHAKLTEVAEAQRDFYTLVGLSRYHFTMGDVNEAQRLLAVARQKLGDDQRPPFQQARAWCDLMVGSYFFEVGNKDEALAHYERALALRPNWIEVLEHRAEWEATYGKADDAVAMYERILAQNTRPSELLSLADVLEEQQKSDEAEALVVRAEKMLRKRLASGDVSVHRELALLIVDRKAGCPEARSIAEKDMKIRQDILAWDTLAWVSHRCGDNDRAAIAIAKATQYKTPLRILEEHRAEIEKSIGKLSRR